MQAPPADSPLTAVAILEKDRGGDTALVWYVSLTVDCCQASDSLSSDSSCLSSTGTSLINTFSVSDAIFCPVCFRELFCRCYPAISSDLEPIILRRSQLREESPVQASFSKFRESWIYNFLAVPDVPAQDGKPKHPLSHVLAYAIVVVSKVRTRLSSFAGLQESSCLPLLGFRPGALRLPCAHPFKRLCSAGWLSCCSLAAVVLLTHCCDIGLRGECAPSVGLFTLVFD